MKRASYRNGIDFIAMNDNCDMVEEKELVGTGTVFLMAELFGVTQEKVAKDVINYRKKQEHVLHQD